MKTETQKIVKIEVISEHCSEHLQLDLENGDRILATKNHIIGGKKAEEWKVSEIIKK